MLCTLVLSLITTTTPLPDWEVKEILTAGQPMLAANDKGVVYIAHHQPGGMLISRDWGATFGEARTFSDALSDVRITAAGDRLQLNYLCTGAAGIRNYYSFDAGKSLRDGGKILGDMDRATIVNNPKTADLILLTSLGYPGGPTSQGILAYRSTDFGRSFTKSGRADEMEVGIQAVDPNLAVGSDGTLYATWATTKNGSTLSSIVFASSSNGGKTWKNRTELAQLSTKGDTQERWMLGGLLASGNRVIAYYPDYVEKEIGGEKHQILLTHLRISEDGGGSFGPEQIATPAEELDGILKVQPNYRQTMPAMALDAAGKLHLAYVDNREGTSSQDKRMTNWSVRYAFLGDNAKNPAMSETVAPSFSSVRAPLELIGCAVDSKFLYVSWSQNPGSTEDLDYRGALMFARKARS